MKNIHNYSTKELDSIIGRKDGWYSQEEFSDLVKKEQNRSDRTGLPISYIVIDLCRQKKNSIISPEDYPEFLKKLLIILSENTRNYDLKCLFDQTTIQILLIDTSLDGAKNFIEKISNNFFEYFQSLNKIEYINLIRNVIISAYPVKKFDNAQHLKGTPILLRKLKYKSKIDQKTMNFCKKSEENFRFKIDWYRVGTSSNGTLALENSLEGIFNDYAQLSINSKVIKRLMDIIGALIGIAFFAPLMIFIAFIIKLTSDGPVLFKQKRAGYRGELFTFFKFRTMKSNCDESIHKKYVQNLINGKNGRLNNGSENQPLYKIVKDPRVTKVGRFLRRTSLDELPQFFNVLFGQMSLVGPRPPIPYELADYHNWHYRRVLDAKPGLTGYWQVYGRSRTTFDEMVRMDLYYVRNQSLWFDIQIILKTLTAVLMTDGAF